MKKNQPIPTGPPRTEGDEERTRAILPDKWNTKPSLAPELDRILYDASIWSRSSDTKNAEIELHTLRAKLAALRR